MAKAVFGGLLASLKASTPGGVVRTAAELRQQQFGLPLAHYAQWYLFGATGLRMHVFHSIAGSPASCKSPLLFDLMLHNAEEREYGGNGGVSVLFELEEKISASLLDSMTKQHHEGTEIGVLDAGTLEEAMKYWKDILTKSYKENYPKYDVPLLVGFDSIGGAASRDT